MLYLDLSELDRASSERRWLWSARRRPALAWFRSERTTYGDPVRSARPVGPRRSSNGRPASGRRGPIRLLTHLRYFGYCMNPVSLLLLLRRGKDEQRRDVIVAEVHNTPWGERHCYVLDAERRRSTDRARTSRQRYRFAEGLPCLAVHVHGTSMYDWRFVDPGDATRPST
jgi:DUF1365 family protein